MLTYDYKQIKYYITVLRTLNEVIKELKNSPELQNDVVFKYYRYIAIKKYRIHERLNKKLQEIGCKPISWKEFWWLLLEVDRGKLSHLKVRAQFQHNFIVGLNIDDECYIQVR